MPQSSAIFGIDLGSRNVKICRMESGRVVSRESVETITFYRTHGVRGAGGFSTDLTPFGYREGMPLVATGYGRMTAAVPGATIISEIKAHALGARFQSGRDDFTLLDMGGQDYKVIHVRGGRIEDFATNDKCAASTGRYLENMARVLGMSLEELGRYAENPVTLSGTCAIFGESELIGMIVQGMPPESLAAGVNRTVVQRVLPLLDRMGEGIIALSGGVALNAAVVTHLREATGREVIILPDPLFNGAIGCCANLLLEREPSVS